MSAAVMQADSLLDVKDKSENTVIAVVEAEVRFSLDFS